jgi:hypothetical protein
LAGFLKLQIHEVGKGWCGVAAIECSISPRCFSA